jgi:hypothetical protein
MTSQMAIEPLAPFCFAISPSSTCHAGCRIQCRQPVFHYYVRISKRARHRGRIIAGGRGGHAPSGHCEGHRYCGRKLVLKDGLRATSAVLAIQTSG